MLRTNNTLELLDLTGNKIGNIGVKAICEALLDNTSLKVLNIKDNQITDEGAKAIAHLLSINKGLLHVGH